MHNPERLVGKTFFGSVPIISAQNIRNKTDGREVAGRVTSCLGSDLLQYLVEKFLSFKMLKRRSA
jgi:hypothetical protein